MRCQLATAFGVMGAPGSLRLEFTVPVAGRGGRSLALEFTSRMATAFDRGEPGRGVLEFNGGMAGLGGRQLEFTDPLAPAVRKGAPGSLYLEFITNVAGRRGRSDRLEFTLCVATAIDISLGLSLRTMTCLLAHPPFRLR
jgi:hypothetical protein